MKIEGRSVPGCLPALHQRDQLPGPDSDRYIELFRHGTLAVGLYAPRGNDEQHPHTRDEVYVIVSGSGRFQRAGKDVVFGPGDVLFVAAGEEHRFVDFTQEFAAWVFFYGPEGGEPEKV